LIDSDVHEHGARLHRLDHRVGDHRGGGTPGQQDGTHNQVRGRDGLSHGVGRGQDRGDGVTKLGAERGKARLADVEHSDVRTEPNGLLNRVRTRNPCADHHHLACGGAGSASEEHAAAAL